MPSGQILSFVLAGLVGLAVVIKLLMWFLGVRIIGNAEVGIVEKTWGGGSLKNQIIALNEEAGFQPDVLRGGVHMLPGWRYRVHKLPLVTVHRGQIGYVFARDGQPLGRYMSDGKEIVESGQTLAHVVNNGNFTDARAFLKAGGQQGPQRAILREGTYAINLAQFVVITGQSEIYYLPLGNHQEDAQLKKVAEQIASQSGFAPVIIDGKQDQIGIVTVHDGPSLPQGQIIAPTVGDSRDDANYHNNFQDPQAFLSAKGYRGRQYQVLSDGTYWINRLFATVELINKTHVEIGYVGVVVSFYGERGADTSGELFKHGELCKKGGLGIWEEALLPGKYAFNTYAGQVVTVPTTNIILKWIKAEEGSHKLDTSLREIGLITKDAFEPELPLSVVISIDYRKAPHVIQRFGSVKNLIDQSLDPLVSSYFKNQGQKRTLIHLIQERSEIQAEATEEMKARFSEYDLGLQEVLIGTPHSPAGNNLIESILNQLRERQVAEERIATYKKQEEAQTGLRSLNEAEAVARKQSELTDSKVQIEIEVNAGDASARRAEMDARRAVTEAKAAADQTVLKAKAEAEQTTLRAKAEAEQTTLRAKAEAERTLMQANAEAEGQAMVKMAEALGIREVRKAYGSAELIVQREVLGKLADAIRDMKQPMVPRTVINMGGADGAAGGEGNNSNMLSMLMTLIMSDKLKITDVVEGDETLSPEMVAFEEKIKHKKEEPWKV
jgi:uncharacterized membrane protein YqiK